MTSELLIVNCKVLTIDAGGCLSGQVPHTPAPSAGDPYAMQKDFDS